MHAFDVARALLAEQISALPAEVRPLSSAVGCRLAAAVRADVDLPPHDVSAMDGYAVRLADLGDNGVGGRLPVAFEIPAGTFPVPLPPGQAARIFTGAAIPDGADTIVMQEDVTVEADAIRINKRARLGDHIRWAGEVVGIGAEMARQGDWLTPQRVGLLVAGGAATVRVIRRPSVAIVTTGSELVSAREKPGPAQIRDSNGPMLGAFVEWARLPLVSHDRTGDRLETLSASIQGALATADVVVVTGGVSVGDYDLVPKVVAQMGGRIVVHGVKMQPGKPLLVAQIGDTWLVGLPGNPVAVVVGWRLFARPLCEALAGHSAAFAEVPATAHLSAAQENSGNRLQLLPGTLTARARDWPEVAVHSWKGSHDVAAVAGASVLVRLTETTTYSAGSEIGYYPMQWPQD